MSHSTIDYLTFVGLGIGFIGLIATFWCWTKACRKRAFFTTNSFMLAEFPSDMKVSLKYEGYGELAKRICITEISIWNRRFTLTESDFARLAPLELQIEDGVEIVECCVAEQESEACNFKTRRSRDRANAKISFDHLDIGEFVVLRIVHTGDPTSLSLTGKIRGGDLVFRPALSGSRVIAWLTSCELGFRLLMLTLIACATLALMAGAVSALSPYYDRYLSAAGCIALSAYVKLRLADK